MPPCCLLVWVVNFPLAVIPVAWACYQFISTSNDKMTALNQFVEFRRSYDTCKFTDSGGVERMRQFQHHDSCSRCYSLSESIAVIPFQRGLGDGMSFIAGLMLALSFLVLFAVLAHAIQLRQRALKLMEHGIVVRGSLTGDRRIKVLLVLLAACLYCTSHAAAVHARAVARPTVVPGACDLLPERNCTFAVGEMTFSLFNVSGCYTPFQVVLNGDYRAAYESGCSRVDAGH